MRTKAERHARHVSNLKTKKRTEKKASKERGGNRTNIIKSKGKHYQETKIEGQKYYVQVKLEK